jgi:hypothetical protein
MTVIDDRGRLFGRVNLIDAVVGILLFALIPLAYGAFILFRVPKPTIDAITPAQVVEHGQGSVRLTGSNIRPFLLARIGPLDSSGFFVQSPSLAEIKLPELPPGTYDVALYDQGQELVRKPNALTVVPLASASGRMSQEVVGAFVDLDNGSAGTIHHNARYEFGRAGDPASSSVEIVALQPYDAASQRMPAIIRVDCAVRDLQCQVNGTPIARDAKIKITDRVVFAVESVGLGGMSKGFASIATINVKFATVPELLDVLKPGDVDIGPGGPADRATLVTIGSNRRTITTRAKIEERDRPRLEFDQQQVEFVATIRVPVGFTPSGWTYEEKPIKVGSLFTFEAVTGVMMGWIVDMNMGAQN